MSKKEEVRNRTIAVAEYIVANKCTIRQAASHFNIGKTTVHYDCTKRLKDIDLGLYSQVTNVLMDNFNNKHYALNNA